MEPCDHHRVPANAKSARQQLWRAVPHVGACLPGRSPVRVRLSTRLRLHAVPVLTLLRAQQWLADDRAAAGSRQGLDPESVDARIEVYRLWQEDLARLRAEFDTAGNLAYYLPYYRQTSNSHCVSVAGFGELDETALLQTFATEGLGGFAWRGSEIPSSPSDIDFRGFVEQLLSAPGPLTSYLETMPEGPLAACAPPVDRPACDAAAAGP